jgi:hypothetical protein
VNLGVYLPELEAVMFGVHGEPTPPSRFIPEYRCHVRQRLGYLLGDSDTWWGLDLPVAEFGLLMTELIRTHAIPFLDRFPDRDAISAQWERDPALVPWLTPGSAPAWASTARWGPRREGAGYGRTRITSPRRLKAMCAESGATRVPRRSYWIARPTPSAVAAAIVATTSTGSPGR